MLFSCERQGQTGHVPISSHGCSRLLCCETVQFCLRPPSRHNLRHQSFTPRETEVEVFRRPCRSVSALKRSCHSVFLTVASSSGSFSPPSLSSTPSVPLVLFLFLPEEAVIGVADVHVKPAVCTDAQIQKDGQQEAGSWGGGGVDGSRTEMRDKRMKRERERARDQSRPPPSVFSLCPQHPPHCQRDGEMKRVRVSEQLTRLHRQRFPPSLAHSLAHSLARSLARSLSRSIHLTPLFSFSDAEG